MASLRVFCEQVLLRGSRFREKNVFCSSVPPCASLLPLGLKESETPATQAWAGALAVGGERCQVTDPMVCINSFNMLLVFIAYF